MFTLQPLQCAHERKRFSAHALPLITSVKLRHLVVILTLACAEALSNSDIMSLGLQVCFWTFLTNKIRLWSNGCFFTFFLPLVTVVQLLYLLRPGTSESSPRWICRSRWLLLCPTGVYPRSVSYVCISFFNRHCVGYFGSLPCSYAIATKYKL